MIKKPPSAKDGIWRFNRILDLIFNEPISKESWFEIENQARKLNSGKDTWDQSGYGIVASYAQNKGAYATPGFASARRNYMS